MHLLIWALAAVALVFWSLFGWVSYAVLTIDPAWVGDVSAWVKRIAEQVPGAAMLDTWWPGWQGLLQVLLESTQALLGGVAGVAPWIVAAVWAVGALALLGAAAVASLVWHWLRPRATPQPAGASAA